MILVPTNRRVIRPDDKPSFEHTQRYGLIKGHWANVGRVLFLPYNEGSGLQVLDLSGYDNHGVLGGTAPSWNGKWVTAIDLPGTDERVVVADSPELDGFSSFTLLINIFLRDWGGITGSTITYKWDDFGGEKLSWAFRVMETHYLRGGFKDSGDTNHFLSDDTTQLNLGQHYEVGFVYDGQYLRLFLDGVEIKSSSIGAFTVKSTAADVHIGAQRAVGGGWLNVMNGIVGNSMIWNRALSAAEIAELSWNPYAGVERRAAPVYFFVPAIDVMATPSTLEVDATIHAPTIITERNVTVTPTTLETTTTIHAPTIITAEAGVTVYPAPLEIKATLHAPHLIIPYVDIPPFMHKDLIDFYSGGAWLWLVEIDVVDLPSGSIPTRIARNTEDVHYGGHDYDKFNLQIGEQVFSGDGSIPRVTLRIFQDINRRIEDIINETEGALGAAIKLIRVNEKFLDTPVAALEQDYNALATESDTEWVTFTLGIPNPLMQRFPLLDFNSSICPWANPESFKEVRCQYSGGDTSCTGTYDDCRTKGNAEHWGGELGLDPNVVRV